MKRIKSYKAFESLSSFSSSYWSISAQDELMSAIKSRIYMLELEFDRKI